MKIGPKLEAGIKMLNLCKSRVLLLDPHIQTDLCFHKGQKETEVVLEREARTAVISEGLREPGVWECRLQGTHTHTETSPSCTGRTRVPSRAPMMPAHTGLSSKEGPASQPCWTLGGPSHAPGLACSWPPALGQAVMGTTPCGTARGPGRAASSPSRIQHPWGLAETSNPNTARGPQK